MTRLIVEIRRAGFAAGAEGAADGSCEFCDWGCYSGHLEGLYVKKRYYLMGGMEIGESDGDEICTVVGLGLRLAMV